MVVEKLKQILNSDDQDERRILIDDFQREVWDGRFESESELSEILKELAYDLEFYEPDENLRKESVSYYGEERLKTEIGNAMKKLARLANSK